MVTRKIKKCNSKKTRVHVSNPSRINQNAMKVIIKTAAKNDEPPKLKEVNAPYKRRRVEAFKKKTPLKHEKVLKGQTSKKFPNSRFQKILD
jgi:predicted metalloprotease